MTNEPSQVAHELRGVILDRDKCIALLEAENIKLHAWVSDLQGGMAVNCVYCGHCYGPTENTPVSRADLLKAHVEFCPGHPMAALKNRLAGLEAEYKGFRDSAADTYKRLADERQKLETALRACTTEEGPDQVTLTWARKLVGYYDVDDSDHEPTTPTHLYSE